MASLLAKFGSDKFVFLAILGLALVSFVMALILPPIDSHLKPPPLVFWSLVTLLALLTVCIAIAVPTYLYRSWARLRTVPNKTAYVIWLGFETLLAFACAIGVAVFLLQGLL